MSLKVIRKTWRKEEASNVIHILLSAVLKMRNYVYVPNAQLVAKHGVGAQCMLQEV